MRWGCDAWAGDFMQQAVGADGPASFQEESSRLEQLE